jgi:hypothetical protein
MAKKRGDELSRLLAALDNHFEKADDQLPADADRWRELKRHILRMREALTLRPEPGEQPQRLRDEERVMQALSKLLKRTNTDSYVIFIDGNTGAFVQLLTSPPGNLMFDLPDKPLGQPAMARAEQYFARRGVELTSSQLYRDAQMAEPAGIARSFQLDLGRDVQRATRVVFEVFDEIYRLPQQFELTIEEN